MELELGLALPDPGPKAAGELGGKKRGFDDDDHGGCGAARLETSNKRKRLVGWPPVKCAHRRCVKVKMEGVAIGRKADVSLNGSYDELLRTLDRMFPPSADQAVPAEDDVGGRRDPSVVTYEDGEGDWLLVGDVPWEALAKSVLNILA